MTKLTTLNFAIAEGAESDTQHSPAPSINDMNPCLTCGACCAFYRASFYWAEADDVPGGTVPAELTEPFNGFRRVMKGTQANPPRCIALQGEIGIIVLCSIYDKRSTICRDFEFSGKNGITNERCDQARLAWHLPPLPTDDPEDPDEPTRPITPGNLPKAA
jgi:uncharacterized protein